MVSTSVAAAITSAADTATSKGARLIIILFPLFGRKLQYLREGCQVGGTKLIPTTTPSSPAL